MYEHAQSTRLDKYLMTWDCISSNSLFGRSYFFRYSAGWWLQKTSTGPHDETDDTAARFSTEELLAMSAMSEERAAYSATRRENMELLFSRSLEGASSSATVPARQTANHAEGNADPL